MNGSSRRSFFWGLLIIGLGVLWLLNNLEITNIELGEMVSTYWPLLLVAWGLEILFKEGRTEHKSASGIVNGLIVLGLGLLLLGWRLELYYLDWTHFWKVFWPAVLILIGWNLLRSGREYKGGTHWTVMSGMKMSETGWKLESGGFIVIMGGVDLDLRSAAIPPGETVLHLTAIMGGIEVKIPDWLAVECEGTAVLGGVTLFKDDAGGIIASRRTVRPGGAGSNSRVKIYCRTIMGGIEIKEA